MSNRDDCRQNILHFSKEGGLFRVRFLVSYSNTDRVADYAREGRSRLIIYLSPGRCGDRILLCHYKIYLIPL